jgi:di/tricarboxylate transporter
MNNTPIVAILIPSIKRWASKNNLSVSKFLIPLSYAAIFGGMCTLIGTSTNLIVHGLMLEHGYQGFSFFELTKVGLPVAAVGMIYILTIGQRLLPNRKEPFFEIDENTRDYVIELKVTGDYPNVGKTIEQCGLRHLKGLFLFQIERNWEVIAPASPDEIIKVGDRLFFTGIPETILELQKTPGLQLIKDPAFDLKNYDSDKIQAYEAVVSHSSPLVGKRVKDSNFRGKYNSVILAIHRNGERIKSKIGDIVIEAGDTLLILGPRKFFNEWYYNKDFYLISSAPEVYSKPSKQAWFSVGVLLVMILLIVFNIVPLISAAGLAAVILIITKSISPQNAKNMIDWKVLIVIGSAFGIAVGIENSGIAGFMADIIVGVGSKIGTIGVLVGIYAITSIYNTIITSNATSALIFPIALSSALAVNADVNAFGITVAVASAASFASPLSYQTNLMVYGPGGYKFKDYLKIGAPLQILVGIFAILLINFFYL